MVLKFSSTLKGERLTLKRITPTVKMAKVIFKLVDENRKHLEPWMPWVFSTLSVEDVMKYLFELDLEIQKGNKVDYGIYLDKEYLGNISVFDLNEKTKSAEIGYWLSASHTRKGYITEAVKIIEKEVFINLNLNRIQICCDEQNLASKNLAIKCGYICEAVLRDQRFSEYHDEFHNGLIFSKLRSEFK